MNAVMSSGCAEYEMETGTMPPWAGIMEIGFVAFYCAELTLKLIVHKEYYFVNDDWAWNNLDVWLVLAGVYGCIVWLVDDTAQYSNITLARLGRVMKLSKLLRVFRAVKFLAPLRDMLNALARSTSMLFWALVFLTILMWVVALILLQGFAEVAHRAETSQAQMDVIDVMYGTIMRGIYTLFVISTLGDTGLWASTFEIAYLAGEFYVILLLLYISFFHISLYNILTGIVVEHVVASAQMDESERIALYRQTLWKQGESLKRLFARIDLDNTGTITEAEFLAAMNDDELLFQLKGCQVNPTDAHTFFAVLDTHGKSTETDAHRKDKGVSIEHFVDGCMQMRGAAAGIDAQILRCQANHITKSLRHQYKEIHQMKELLRAVCVTVSNAQVPPAAKQRRSVSQKLGTVREDSGPHEFIGAADGGAEFMGSI